MKSISNTAKIGLNVTIGENVIIKNNVVISNNVTIYDNVEIEEDAYIWDNAVIGRIPMGVSTIFSEINSESKKTIIGRKCVIGCNAVIYTDTFIGEDSLLSDNIVIRERVTLQGQNIIGPNTFIQKDCKLGIGTRVVQQSSLASGTVIGKNNFLSSGFTCVSDDTFGVGGYSPDKVGPNIGDNNLFGPNVTVLDNLLIGNNNLIGAKSLITKTIGDNGVYYGIPAKLVRTKIIDDNCDSINPTINVANGVKKLPHDFRLDRYGLQVRLVKEDDAEFIISLRTDPRLSKHINFTSTDIEEQKQWIRDYKLREEQGLDFYFLFSLNDQPQGFARIYNITDDAFTQGSWIFSPNAALGTSILGHIISSEIGFEFLEKKIEYTDARRDNNTNQYVKSFNPEIIKADELNIYYKILPEGFNQGKKKYIALCTKAIDKYKIQ